MNTTILSTGGTIASTDSDGGPKPTQTGEELLEAVPELEAHAEVTVEDVAQVPSFEMDGETLEAIGERVRELDAESGVDTVVVTSRCLEGRVTPVYGGDGGGERLREYGAIFGDDRSPRQARLRLALALEVVDDLESIRAAFETDA